MSDGAFRMKRHAERGWQFLSGTLRTTTALGPLRRPRPTKQR
jgi:hypothetical protein